MSLKELGNEHFKAGDYKAAELLYTQAIQANSKDPKLFSNRALTRVRLQDWEGSDFDSRKSIELYGPKNPLSLKPQYYLAQALLGQNHPEEALHIARYAYATCLETRDPSTEILSQFILRAKQGLWKTQETARLRGLNATLKQVEELLDEYTKSEMAALEARYSHGEIGEVGRNEEKAEMLAEAREKQEHIRLAFKSAGVDMAERVVPDYLVDGITFEIMHDPVITPSGVSYERVSIMKHIKASPFDPLTREPLEAHHLIPNIALKEACNDFLGKNGWAIDY